jgi:hypothetical protein
MIYEVVFETHSGTHEILQYKLHDTDIVLAWIECLYSGEKILNYDSYGLHGINAKESTDIIVNAYNSIKDKLLLKHQNIDINYPIAQVTLNKLHEVFHYYQDRYVEFNLYDKKSKKYLQDLNGEIHNLEVASDSDNTFFMIVDPISEYQGISIKHNWYKKYFNNLPQNGDLLLGYATPGKELIEIYNTDDTNNLNNISPQKNVKGECRLWFQPYKKEESCLNVEILKKWCEKNGKTHLSDPELYTFRPKLGTLKTSLTFDELKYKLLNFKEIVNWEIK